MPLSPPPLPNPLLGREYRSFDGNREWEFSYEGIKIVILRTGLVFEGHHHNLIGIDANTYRVVWSIPSAGPEDSFMAVWFLGGKFLAATWYCFTYEFNYRTGEVLSKVWTK